MASTKWYGKAAQAVASKRIDLVNDDIKVMLVASSYTPNVDTHSTKADLTGEVTGSGYTPGGVSLANKTFTQKTADNKWTFDANDVAWAGLSATFRYAVLYDNTDAAKSLIGYVDFGADQQAASQDVTIKWEYQYQDEAGSVVTGSGILEMGY